jgi:hypothetical protein
MKILRRTQWVKGTGADDKEESSVFGRFVESLVPDIYKSKRTGKEVMRKTISCQIKVEGSEVKDMVCHEILEKDDKSNFLKKRFKAAWERFQEIKGIEPDADPITDDAEISAETSGEEKEAKK